MNSASTDNTEELLNLHLEMVLEVLWNDENSKLYKENPTAYNKVRQQVENAFTKRTGFTCDQIETILASRF
jgi:hypothetical protein